MLIFRGNDLDFANDVKQFGLTPKSIRESLKDLKQTNDILIMLKNLLFCFYA